MSEVGFKQTLVGDVSIGYSGGLDSTSVAYIAARQKKGRVHLHTFRHGYGYLYYWWARKAVRDLQKALGADVILHRFINTQDLFKEIAMKSLFADLKTYGSSFGCCLGCTLAFITKTIIYNLENGVPHIMFGSSVGGEYAVMSMPVTRAGIQSLCAQYGILYNAPLLENNIVKSVEREMLDKAGIFRGHRFLDKHSFANQGYCLLSVQHLPDVLFNVHPIHAPEAVGRFIADKRPACEQYIENYFTRTGGNLEELAGRLRALTSAGSVSPS